MLARRFQALGGVRRRHADVDDRDIRPVARDEVEQPGDVAGLADHLESARGERIGQGLAQEDARRPRGRSGSGRGASLTTAGSRRAPWCRDPAGSRR